MKLLSPVVDLYLPEQFAWLLLTALLILLVRLYQDKSAPLELPAITKGIVLLNALLPALVFLRIDLQNILPVQQAFVLPSMLAYLALRIATVLGFAALYYFLRRAYSLTLATYSWRLFMAFNGFILLRTTYKALTYHEPPPGKDDLIGQIILEDVSNSIPNYLHNITTVLLWIACSYFALQILSKQQKLAGSIGS